MDWNEIATLLSVIHQAAAAGPKYAKWAALAEAELERIANPPSVTPGPAVEDHPAEPPPADGSTHFTGDDATDDLAITRRV